MCNYCVPSASFRNSRLFLSNINGTPKIFQIQINCNNQFIFFLSCIKKTTAEGVNQSFLFLGQVILRAPFISSWVFSVQSPKFKMFWSEGSGTQNVFISLLLPFLIKLQHPGVGGFSLSLMSFLSPFTLPDIPIFRIYM